MQGTETTSFNHLHLQSKYLISSSIHYHFPPQIVSQVCSGTATTFFQPHPLFLPSLRIICSPKAIAFCFRNLILYLHFLLSHEQVYRSTGVLQNTFRKLFTQEVQSQSWHNAGQAINNEMIQIHRTTTKAESAKAAQDLNILTPGQLNPIPQRGGKISGKMIHCPPILVSVFIQELRTLSSLSTQDKT